VLTQPYVTVAAFRAHPTYLDTTNLRSGNSPNDQGAALREVLLKASAWADNFVSSGGFAAHVRTEQTRVWSDRYGRLHLSPADIPVTAVSGLSYGPSPTQLTTIIDPSVWIEDGRQVVVELGAGSVSWVGSLQFGAPVSADMFVQWSYTAGYVHTNMAASTSAGTTSITVADPTGTAPGVVLRITDPGREEAVTVAPSYVAGSTTVPLTAATTYAHTVTSDPACVVGVSALPADAHLAVVHAATAMLMRPDSAAEDAYPDTQVKTSTRDADPRHEGSGLILEAKRILRSYRKAR
jgi:hypothetical protein